MKILGLIGGMSWESTIPYYRHINQYIREQLGGLHSAHLILYSVDFSHIETLQQQGDWHTAGQILAAAAQSLRAAGAEAIVVCTNTMHKVSQQIEQGCGLPLLHIADATAEEIQQKGVTRVGLLGTRFTMEQEFYRRRIEEKYGIEVLIPESCYRDDVHRIIYDELCQGIISDASREVYREVIQHLEQQGAEGIILGCTEITLLVGPEDATVPLFDTTAIHARRAAKWALSHVN